MFDKSHEETLVGGNLLSYAYLEAGMLEFAAGCVYIGPFDLRTSSYPLVTELLAILLFSAAMGSLLLTSKERRKWGVSDSSTTHSYTRGTNKT